MVEHGYYRGMELLLVSSSDFSNFHKAMENHNV